MNTPLMADGIGVNLADEAPKTNFEAPEKNISRARFSIEPLTADNRRPGDGLLAAYVVYYRPHDDFGWTGRRIFMVLEDAQAFTDALPE